MDNGPMVCCFSNVDADGDLDDNADNGGTCD
jgi:hypothetical protein